METENKRGLILKQQSGISTIRANQINDVSQHGAILSDLSLSIKQAIDSPSFNQLKAQGANLKETRQVLAVLISKYANMLTVGGNLRPEHPMQYAESIIQDNPSMSLDDFNILLANGVKGRYNDPGKLFRFDISVIYDWIRAYQEQFWEVKENLPRQKTALEMLPDQQLEQIQDVIAKAEGVKQVRPMTNEEAQEEGRAKLVNHIGEEMTMKEYQAYQKQKQAYQIMSREQYIEREVMAQLNRQYSLECFDKYGNKLEGALSFEEWLKL